MKKIIVNLIMIISFLSANLTPAYARSTRGHGAKVKLPEEMSVVDLISEKELEIILYDINRPESIEMLGAFLQEKGLDFKSESVLSSLYDLEQSQKSLKQKAIEKIKTTFGFDVFFENRYKPNYSIRIKQTERQKDVYELQLCLLFNKENSEKICEEITQMAAEDYANLLYYSKYKEQISAALYSVRNSKLAEYRDEARIKSIVAKTVGIVSLIMMVGGFVSAMVIGLAGWTGALMLLGFLGMLILVYSGVDVDYEEWYDKRGAQIKLREEQFADYLRNFENKLKEYAPEIYEDANRDVEIPIMP